MSVEDFTGGGAWLSCFDDVGQLILGMTADQLNEIRERDSVEYANVFERALSQTFNFNVKAKFETYNDQSRYVGPPSCKVRANIFQHKTQCNESQSVELCG